MAVGLKKSWYLFLSRRHISVYPIEDVSHSAPILSNTKQSASTESDEKQPSPTHRLSITELGLSEYFAERLSRSSDATAYALRMTIDCVTVSKYTTSPKPTSACQDDLETQYTHHTCLQGAGMPWRKTPGVCRVDCPLRGGEKAQEASACVEVESCVL